MKLLEQYDELVERNGKEISFAWKGSLIFAYLLSTVSSYACAILFYYYWYDICGGHCMIWAEAEFIQKHPNFFLHISPNNDGSYDWSRNFFSVYKYRTHCKWFHFVCLLSFSFAVMLLMMFSICGRGGRDSSLFVAPWRVVVPALILSLVFMIIALIVEYQFNYGHIYFSEIIKDLAQRSLKEENNPFTYNQSALN